MSTTVKSLTYRGDVKAAVGVGGTLVFTTVHPEGQPTGVYRLDIEKLTLSLDALPAGGTALVADKETVWVGGSDGHIYRASARGGAPTPLGPPLLAAPLGLALLADDRLAVLTGASVVILSRKDGAVRQTLELPDEGTCLAADPTGQWLAVGTVKGTVAVYDGEAKAEFTPSESAKLHDGAATALLFEQEELRFLSAGADNKLLSTHARGKLEPEDRGKGSNHSEPVVALLWAPGDRFCTGSRDKTVKSWPRAGGKPATLKDGVITVVALALVQFHKRPHLAVGCDDNSFRLFAVEEDGKIGDPTHRVNDAYAWAKYEFTQDESRRREAALRALAGWNDTPSVEMISEQVGKDGDHVVRKLAAQLLGASDHPRAAKLLEQWLKHNDEAVRVAAFEGLRRHLGEQDFRPLDMALKVEKADVGRLAVLALEKLAAKDDQALTRLLESLNHNTPEVRQAALASLERVHPADSPEANLLALNSRHADLRRLTLVRLFQRQMLGQARVQAALRWRTEDADAEVRRTAFLLALSPRPKLVPALRARDAELHRQLFELETFTQDGAPDDKKEVPPQPKVEKLSLADADYEPLLQATASRSLDTCLRGARGLAVLGDARAFGLLLQLSREPDAASRAEVCRALAALDDPRSVKRLRSLLFDADATVRDAAFTALAQIHENDPLLCAEAGLGAQYEDVRRRGLQALISAIRKAPPKSAREPAWDLLVRALNDSDAGVRSEAFKAALNLQVAGGGVHTLRFVLQSIHADIRLEVLTELTAQFKEEWAWNLLLEFYNDHDPTLRGAAFEFACKKTKELTPLEVGLRSQYADIRKKAVDGLIKKHTPAAQALLVKALTDSDKEVRQLALESLVGEDARGPLAEALNSPHADVRVRAGKALARHGDSTALAALLALAAAPEPQEQERRAEWEELAGMALAGLAQLGDPAALPHLVPLLNSKHDAIRKNAAFALTWVALPHQVETLRQALQHADPQVKYRAALGLAYAGDVYGSLALSEQANAVLTDGERLVAALALGTASEEPLVQWLDHGDEKLRNWALLLLMLLELKAHQGTPARCLACLSSAMPRVRLTAARGLEGFADPAAFREFVAQLFNDRGDEAAWKVPAETVDAVAELLVHGSPPTRARTAQLLQYLSEKEQAPWNQAWAIHEGRFAREIAALREKARERPAVASQYTRDQLQQLAFGAYVGLVREQGGQSGTPPAVVRIRQTALSRIMALAKAEEDDARAAKPVFVQALGDPNQPVRLQAFEHLQALGMDSAELGAEALEVGHLDLGVRGLELLTEKASVAEGQAVLERAMLARGDDLATEAAKLLSARRGQVAVAGQALEAVHAPLRELAVQWLAAEYDKDKAAQQHLRRALDSRYQRVREAAAFELATKKDPAAFDALVKMLASQDQYKQRNVIYRLKSLGDPRTPDAFLDRLENDPSGTACTEELLQGAGEFRRPENADRLLALFEKNPKWREPAFRALLAASGHDQSIDDPEEERSDRRWEEKQHPRRDAILARLTDRCFALGEARFLYRLVRPARWARGQQIDPVLALLVSHSDEGLRQQAVEALGWRLRKRQGPAEPLLKALQHRDPVTQFLAAEGLARAKRAEGISVLLAAVDFMTDVNFQRRAVAALGELGDLRALDTLLKLANETGHALQETAAEALGHLGKSDKADEIFRLLERFAKGQGTLAAQALKGLRWLNTRAGWQLIRQRAADRNFWMRSGAVELLGHNDEPATRDLLLNLLTRDDGNAIEAALASARRLWGPDSLEPDFAFLQNHSCFDDDSENSREALKRVCERAEPRRIFDLLGKCPVEAVAFLAASLMNRPTLPLAEAQAALGSTEATVVQVAARLLGRAGKQAASSGPALASALQKWWGLWQERRQEEIRRRRLPGWLVGGLTDCVQGLIWTAGRLGVGQEALLAAAAAWPDDPFYRPLRLEAITALASGPMTEPVLTALESAAVGNDPELRTTAAEAIGRHNAKRASRLAERLLSDRVSFTRLTRHEGVDVAGTLRNAAGQVHYQGVALPELVKHGDIAGLSAVVANAKLPEATRLGAIEGLALMARESAEAKLLEVGRNEKEDEDLRKAAWKGLRRSKRARQRAKV